ncbi:hypothetical protein Q9323_08800 [Pseudomonas fulva]|uniref:hypothetical protein n=1 Tax=Pseudomonas TaxID=286 RepID=UPI000DADB9DD|nr:MULTISPECIES: hypothetical protein [unclassified Pseudomonas]MCP3791584.1 hypothetical protein [Pseudomonas sp. N2-11]PZW52786.1 hypothetical protein F478_02581 [Pseudomonas sp. URIL14HWK12:I2]PZW53531.1 hypothetical protein F477_03632 [Pseudomonas sp. URIL14HWK12:I3]
MRTHYDPHPQSDESTEQAACGTWLGEESNLTGEWSRVDCRRCLGRKEKISAAVMAEENAIVEQMGHMAAFMQEQH